MGATVAIDYRDNVATVTLVPPDDDRKPPTLSFEVLDGLENTFDDAGKKSGLIRDGT